MPSHAHSTHEGIVKRLRRAEGHLRSVIDMLEDERNCVDIAQQLYAVEKAITQAKRTLIQDHIDHCLASGGKSASTTGTLDEFKQIARYL